MAEHGGKRTPANPAPSSGPGALSRRTDGGPADQKKYQLPSAGYGEQAQYQQLQAGAPLAATPGPGAAIRPRPSGGNRQMPVPFDAPTQRPDEPVTAGAALGPGPGPAALGGGPPSQQTYRSALQDMQGAATAPGGSEAAALLSQLGSSL